MKRRKIWIGILLLVLALAVSVLLGFQGDWLTDAQRSRVRTDMQGVPLLTDGHEVAGAFGCQIAGNRLVVTGEDPQFYVGGGDHEYASVHILFGEPLEQATPVQIFFVRPGDTISEEWSISWTAEAGATELRLPVPETAYEYLRFDIDRNVTLEGIYGVYETQTEVPYSADPVRIALYACACFCVLSLFGVVYLAGRREQALLPGRRRRSLREVSASRKPWGTILLCNLFLSLTVAFFQPFSAVLETAAGYPPEGVWGMQLLWAALMGLGLSGLMLLLPAGAGNLAAAVSLGLGGAFLAQCLLFNPGRPLRMDTDWSITLLNAYVWAGIVIITGAMAFTCRRENALWTGRVMRIAAWVLLAVQLGWVTALWSLGPGKGFRAVTWEYLPEARRETVYAGAETFGEWMELSLERGAPYVAKDAFRK